MAFDSALAKLEFEKILHRVVRYAASQPGAAAISSSSVSISISAIRDQLSLVSEAKRLLESESELPLSGIYPIGSSVRKSSIEGSVLDPDAAATGAYDVVVCIRTLINLTDLTAQRTALANLISWVRPGGRLVLIEGFSDGFAGLTELRESLGLPPLHAAPINVYSALADLRDLLDAAGVVEARFHTGTWDVLTRVVLPLTAGPENALGVGPFHAAFLQVARILGPERTEPFARELGWSIRRPESA